MEDLKNRIICADFMDLQEQIKDESIDLILTDPPYGIGWRSRHRKIQFDHIENDGVEIWLEKLPVWLSVFKRILKPTGVLAMFCAGGGPNTATAFATLEIERVLQIITTVVWDKKVMCMGWNYRPVYENVIIASKNRLKYNFYDKSHTMTNLIRYQRLQSAKDSEHSTMKPPEVMAHFIRLHTKPEDLIFDPFCGSGPVPVAATSLGRNFIACDILPGFCRLASLKVKNSTLDIFPEEKEPTSPNLQGELEI